MSGETWLAAVRDARKKCYLRGDIKIVHYKFSDGTEMIEEYSLDTGMVVKRAVMNTPHLIGLPRWEIEIGEPDSMFRTDLERLGIVESSTAPAITKRITRMSLEWRIRNLPYPIQMYDVVVLPEGYSIVIRTKNKKYYKIIKLTDLERIGVKPEQDKIEYTHQFSTLIITYAKPPELILTEKLVFEEINQMEVNGQYSDCKQS